VVNGGDGVSYPGFHGHVMKAQPAGLRTRRDSHSRGFDAIAGDYKTLR